ncbi:MAG: lysophospholipid acyltransferase family protein [Steroidobacteraceae bacterium]
MREVRGPPIAFSPGRWWERLLFNSVGWPLFVASMRRLAEAPVELTAGERARLQRDIGARLARHLRVRVEYHNLAQLPAFPHIVVSLHEGLADVLFLSQLPLAMRYVARQEIFEWPWIGPALRRMRHISIEPEQGAASYRKLIAAAKATMQAGEHVVLFPQGAVLGVETAFQPGVFRLARTLHAPILPVVLTGAHRIWEHPFSPRVRYGQQVAVVVLSPISADEVQRRAPEELRVHLQRCMKAIALSGRLPEPRHFVPERDGFWDGFAFGIDADFPQLRHTVERHRRALSER